MNKLFSFAAIALLALALIGCGQKSAENQNIKETTAASADAVESANADLQEVDSVEEDLSSDDLEGLDSGLADIENI